ncbi:hypothetical protein KP509_16G079500 [Ceratopteris richardii]|uniref:Uncharacterized protein n=1 Tax=Ceratopteris richardii TaxID=49495 RepID=A0A8T2T0A3_CERRI|nr:hypothetical protein KP509_16G079500 [Ceratopteris richardii]KAH7388519.1 hypothetical protein KP509_16G079500 [Ceratopteris richardii]
MVPETARVPWTKDLSWFDRMYMKLENICNEVDKNPSSFLQETSKYVEKQVNVVGVNMKKICTELIQDILSPEADEKKVECALHCKCHCMDFEKVKVVESDIFDKDIGYFSERDVHDGTVSKRYVSTVKELKKEEKQAPRIPEISVPASKSAHAAVDGDKDHPLIDEIANKEMDSHQMQIETQSPLNDEIKSEAHNEEISEALKPCCMNNRKDESKTPTVETFISKEALLCTREFRVLEQATRPIENGSSHSEEDEKKQAIEESLFCMEETDCREEVALRQAVLPWGNDRKDPHGHSILVPTGRDGDTEDLFESQKGSDTLETLPEIQAKYMDGFLQKQPSDDNLQDDTEAEEANLINRIGGHFHNVCTQDCCEISRSIKEDDLVIVPEFASEEEEQKAHWFLHADLRKALEPDIFGVDKPGQAELDLDWELL